MKESDINLSGEIMAGIITRVELVYLGEDQLLAQVEEGRVLYAQPFWCFSGYYSENSYFDIIIQALPDEYLQPVPLQ
jgi:predicted oxidoreductase